VGTMRDPELHWIRDETVQPIRTRAIGVVVLAVSCVVIGIFIGRLTVGIPSRGSRPPDVVKLQSARDPIESNVERPSLALKSDSEPTTEKPATSPSTQSQAITRYAQSQAVPKYNPPPVVLLNPGTADKNPSATREETRARAARPVRERSLQGPVQNNREPQATGDRRDVFSRPARDYHSLREYMLSR